MGDLGVEWWWFDKFRLRKYRFRQSGTEPSEQTRQNIE